MAIAETRTMAAVRLNAESEVKENSAPSSTGSSALWRLIRSLLLDVPLTLLFSCFLVVFSCRYLHNTYFIPLYRRSERSFVELHDEHTYYHRDCTAQDVSTQEMTDVMLNATEPTSVSMKRMMEHGVVVIPQILTPETTRDLRQYIADRNAALPDNEAYPMSQGERRLSYGLDATEHPSVVRAVQEVAQHTQTRHLVQELLGDVDPAAAELTVISAFPGAIDQVWHSDTKEEGNALKFARTYSHSYSLFIALQDTTEEMGPTDFCPGTHYCSSFDLHRVCGPLKLPLSKASPENVFHAGDGALLNQIVWHRGSAHRDLDAPDRIVFIISFIARPSNDGEDPRQLSRGTYFHLKWNMWGHTLKDMMDPITSMGKPFSILRCLSLYKPSTRNWGYDLVTSAYQRFCNDQLEWEDLDERFMPRLDQFKFPKWLRGESNMEYGQRWGWEMFIRQTLEKTFDFVKKVTAVAHGVYALLVIGTTIAVSVMGKDSPGVLFSSARRIAITHGTLLALTLTMLYSIQTSEWGVNVLNGNLLRRPFAVDQKSFSSDEAWMAGTGLTTLPRKDDVLFGTRYDADFLGSYNDWLDYHAGNVLFLDHVKSVAPHYRSYSKLDPVFRIYIEQAIVKAIEKKEGRFLEQDFRNGDWRILSEAKSVTKVHDELLVRSSPGLLQVRKYLRRALADWRFGLRRQTSMARLSQLQLFHLERNLLEPGSKSETRSQSATKVVRVVSSNILAAPNSGSKEMRHARASSFPPPPPEAIEFPIGTHVWGSVADLSHHWNPGVIDDYDEEANEYSISFEEGGFYIENFNPVHIRKRAPIVEGDRLIGCMEPNLQDCWPGTVDRVMPNQHLMMAFDDGDYEHMEMGTYYVEEYEYAPFMD